MLFKTQRIAYPYFVLALVLFGLQVTVGLWLALNYFVTIPQSAVDVFPFSTARAIHTNLLVLWLLLGFMGATFYLIPEETERELEWPKLAIAQLVLLAGTGVAAIIGFLFGWTQGRPLLEIPRPLDFLVVGIGASAGGLEALQDLLRVLPCDTRLAIVFVQHLDPRARSSLVEILPRSTSISVREASSGENSMSEQ